MRYDLSDFMRVYYGSCLLSTENGATGVLQKKSEIGFLEVVFILHALCRTFRINVPCNSVFHRKRLDGNDRNRAGTDYELF